MDMLRIGRGRADTAGSRRMVRDAAGTALPLLLLTAAVLMAAEVSVPAAQGGAKALPQGSARETSPAAPETAEALLEGLVYEGEMEVSCAESFRVFHYSGGDRQIVVCGEDRYLLVPDSAEIPADLPEDVTVIGSPPARVYDAATASMSLIDAIGALDRVTMTGTDVSGWEIEAPKEALLAGAMTYAGKYSAPNYEMLLEGECDLAVESMMIYHVPEVKEMLEDLGIPVFVDRSSTETGPLGRMEWLKVYGALFDREAEAERVFSEQAEIVANLGDYGNTGLTVAFFSLSSDGSVVVRRSGDYIPGMIRLAGGVYALDGLENRDLLTGSARISMEAFYAEACDADFLIYNATISEPLREAADLVAEDSVFAEFRAYEEGNVWQLPGSLYQSPDRTGEFIRDLNIMLTGGDPAGCAFLAKLE